MIFQLELPFSYGYRGLIVRRLSLRLWNANYILIIILEKCVILIQNFWNFKLMLISFDFSAWIAFLLWILWPHCVAYHSERTPWASTPSTLAAKKFSPYHRVLLPSPSVTRLCNLIEAQWTIWTFLVFSWFDWIGSCSFSPLCNEGFKKVND